MIIQPAKVIAETNSSYMLETLPKSACPRCEAGKGCGGGILAKAFANKTYRLFIDKNTPLQLYQLVQVGIHSSVLVRASIVLYLIPLVFMVAAAVIVGLISMAQDLYTVTAVIVGFVVGVLIARTLSQIYLKTGMTSPVLVDDNKNECWYQE